MSYPPYDPPPYDPPPYDPYYGPPLRSHPNGTTVLVLGILSLVVCSFLGPFAWSMGTRALREIDQSGYPYENRGHIQAGRICGIVSSVLMGITLLFVAFGLTVAIITEAGS
ncbi:DUF4190 domain-containing protein [Actinomadura sp. ATCC 31491]|uniref:DUF4190 domain-containing protein n=1 Tax=Actinomadura luzonensis TaxID=2805427 RepID=A0ABT0FUK0_9ACTN|nr:DUF4190 domain-containing protein [Actinomadura luzonensis]MCK2216002.1 DUF4190 domain-containing protein [Actinomadura luzonensis]